jgi:fructose-1,6-bisphosphatase/inositol monophosphatase family enzyme
VPLDPATGTLAADDVAGQTRSCLAHIAAIVEEAGGRFTSLTGEPGPEGGSALSSNGLLHEAALASLIRR